MVDKMAETQSRDGNTFSFVDYVSSIRFQGFFQFQYGDQDTVLVTYRDQFGAVNETVVKTSNAKMKAKPASNIPKSFKTVFQNDWSVYAVDTIQKIGYLKIKTFRDRKTFKEYYKQVFQHINANGYSKLIVDIRDNGGGYFLNGNHFLTYFTQKSFDYNFRRLDKKIKKNKHVDLDFWSKLTKFSFNVKPKKVKDEGWKTTTFTFKPSENNFKGQVHLLTNGFTFSQAALVAAQLKEKGATVYGTETGGAENSTNCMINYVLTLPNSRLKTTIPHYQAISNSTKGAFGQGIKPHFTLRPEIGSATDNVLHVVIERISTSSKNP
jgi:C-terminal processing protease CtpA/Prc